MNITRIENPEGLDQTKLEALLRSMLNLIDRESLSQDPSLPRALHPLLLERAGKDVALDEEIRCVILNIIVPVTSYDRITNADFLQYVSRGYTEILLRHTKNPEELQAKIQALKEMLYEILDQQGPSPMGSDGYAIRCLVEEALCKVLTNPSEAQKLVTFKVVDFGRKTVLEELSELKKRLLRDLPDKTLRKEVGTEADGVREWYERRVA